MGGGVIFVRITVNTFLKSDGFPDLSNNLRVLRRLEKEKLKWKDVLATYSDTLVDESDPTLFRKGSSNH